jgi:pimeloyl-ACP methyl ester carboxylesterase
VVYDEAGPSDGDVILLLHGFPNDIHSYTKVIPLLAETGRRVITPYLRGHGPTPHFTGPRVHHQVPGAGRNLPQEAQGPFARAVLDLANPAMTATTARPMKGTRP